MQKKYVKLGENLVLKCHILHTLPITKPTLSKPDAQQELCPPQWTGIRDIAVKTVMRTWVMNYSLANLFTDWSLYNTIITGWPLTRYCIPVLITITTCIYSYNQLLANTSNTGCLGQSGRSFHSTKATSDRGFSFYNAQSIQNKSLVIISSIIIIFITEPFHFSFFLETWTNNVFY